MRRRKTHRPAPRRATMPAGSPAPTGCTGPCGPAAASPGVRALPAPRTAVRRRKSPAAPPGRRTVCTAHSIRCAHPAHRAAGQNRTPPSLFRSAHRRSRAPARGTMPRPKGPAGWRCGFPPADIPPPRRYLLSRPPPRGCFAAARPAPFPCPAFRPAVSHAREPGRLRSAPCRTHSPA